MLNAVHQLAGTINDDEVQEVFVGRMRRRVLLQDTPTERDETLREFAQRSKLFVKTSVTWAPDTVLSHLQVRTIISMEWPEKECGIYLK